MDVTWRGVALVDALGSALTPAGVALLESEIADERLAVVTLVGSQSNQRQRIELFAHLLHISTPLTLPSSSGSTESAVTLLACVSYIEEDYRVLVLDVAAAEGSPAWELVGALCALSSLVVSCFDDTDADTGVMSWFSSSSNNNSESVARALPALPQPFTSLFLTLLREHAVADVHELAPNVLTLDFSAQHVLDGLASPQYQRPQSTASSSNATTRDSAAEALDSIVQFKQRGVVSADAVAASTELLAFVAPHAPVKRVFGVELTGETLSLLLQAFVADNQRGDAPDVGSAWDDFVERKCSSVADDALSTYVDCMHASARESPPLELEAFTKLHDEILRLAMDVYHSGAKAFTSSRKRSVRARLKASIRSTYEQELAVLTEHSRAFCEDVRASLWRELAGSWMPGDGSASPPAFAAVLQAIVQFDGAYSSRASGPAKGTVLRAFYRQDAVEAFRRLEALATQQLTEAHLSDLRAQLTAEFDDKKAALIAHFKHEETQLRACMAREIETMQKMHHARSARARIDESETKREHDALRDVKRRNAELERQNAVLEQTLSDTSAQKAALERKVLDLEHSVRVEMASRAELVDTLASTIKSAEAKERGLLSDIDALKHELGEKTFRVESELKDVTTQLRKTNEEKDELQKKLSELFLKITALPPALQQHLFSAESSTEPVQFADALAGFMSR